MRLYRFDTVYERYREGLADRQTDRQTDIIAVACTALACVSRYSSHIMTLGLAA